MNNSGKLFDDEPTNWLICEAGFKHSKCKMSIYCNYELDVYKLGVVSYVDDCVYWYTSEDLGKYVVDTLGKIFHVRFLVYSHLFISIGISQLKDHYISVDQTRYDACFVKNYPYISTIKEN